MREPVILAFDDLILYRTGEKVQCTETATFGWGTTWYEIDLTTGNHREFEDLLLDYLRAARPIDPPAPKSGKNKQSKRNMSMHAQRTRFFRQFREWMESEGRLDECRAPSGAWSHPVSAVREYEKVVGVAEPKRG